MLWYSLLIPCVLSILAYWLWHSKFLWQELLVPLGVTTLFVVISYFTIKTINLKDVEYNGYTVTKASYHEYWETWVDKTCSYTTCNGYDEHGNCTGYTTHYYDCSYCDENSAYWDVTDNGGHTISISQQKYLQLIKQWSATPKFVELNRRIENHGSCGKDGNMYYITWNGLIETSESSVFEKPFTNPLKQSHSAFQYPVISEKDAKKLGLFNYPEFYDYYKQKAVLGMDSFPLLSLAPTVKYATQKSFEYLNGNLGPKQKVKVFILLFKDKSIDIAFKQEAYWNGGNQNELIVCIGMNKDLELEWVKPFSWCDNKRIIVDCREDIMELKKFNPTAMYVIINDNIKKYFRYKSFKDFSWLSFEPTMGQILFVYIGAFLISIGTIIWCVKNEINPSDN